MAAWEAIQTTRFSPKMAWHRLLQPLLAEKGYAGLSFLLFRKRNDAASTFVGKHRDNWAGPVYRETVKLPHPRTKVILVLEHSPQPGGYHSRIDTTLFVDGRKVAHERRTERGQFNLQAVVDRPKDKESVVLELRTRPYFIPRLISGVPDDRKLCALVLEAILRGGSGVTSEHEVADDTRSTVRTPMFKNKACCSLNLLTFFILTLLVWGIHPFARGIRFCGDDFNSFYEAWSRLSQPLWKQLLFKYLPDTVIAPLAFWPFAVAMHTGVPLGLYTLLRLRLDS